MLMLLYLQQFSFIIVFTTTRIELLFIFHFKSWYDS